jgi:hypothetical protein
MILSERSDGGRMPGHLAIGSPWEAGAVFLLLLISSAMRMCGGRRWCGCYLSVLVVRDMMFGCCEYFLCFNLCFCKVFRPGFPYKLDQLFSS